MNKKQDFINQFKVIIKIGIFLSLCFVFVIVTNTRAQTVELQLTISPAEVPPPAEAPSPSLTIISISGFEGISSTSGLPQTTDTTPTFSGKTNIKNAYMFFELYTKPITGTTRADNEGNWSWTVPFPLSLGIHTLFITAVDPNDSSIRITSSLKFEVISRAITAPIFPIPAIPSIPIIEEKPKEILFSINLTIPQEYKKIKPGESILVDIRVLNFNAEVSPETKTDIGIDYLIENDKGNAILSNQEKRAVIGKEEFFSKTFKTPSNIEPGQYTFYAKMTWGEKDMASSSDSFEIISKPDYWKWWLLSILIVSFGGLIYWICRKPR